jgi:hypothetical protein
LSSWPQYGFIILSSTLINFLKSDLWIKFFGFKTAAHPEACVLTKNNGDQIDSQAAWELDPSLSFVHHEPPPGRGVG